MVGELVSRSSFLWKLYCCWNWIKIWQKKRKGMRMCFLRCAVSNSHIKVGEVIGTRRSAPRTDTSLWRWAKLDEATGNHVYLTNRPFSFRLWLQQHENHWSVYFGFNRHKNRLQHFIRSLRWKQCRKNRSDRLLLRIQWSLHSSETASKNRKEENVLLHLRNRKRFEICWPERLRNWPTHNGSVSDKKGGIRSS